MDNDRTANDYGEPQTASEDMYNGYAPTEDRELIEALAELKLAIRELGRQERETNQAIQNVLNSSHLRSTLTLLKEDIGFRRTLEIINSH